MIDMIQPEYSKPFTFYSYDGKEIEMTVEEWREWMFGSNEKETDSDND